MSQGVEWLPAIAIIGHELGEVHEISYFGYILRENFFMDVKLSRPIRHVAITSGKLIKNVWENSKLTKHTKTRSQYIAKLTMCKTQS
jgi:hypothetical protein